MSASITTSGLGWATPEGHWVFTNLNLSFNQERVGIVGRNGVGKSSLLKLLSGLYQPAAGTVTVRGTIALLGQSLQVRPDDTVADLFGITADLALLQRAEAGDATVDEMADLDWTLESRLMSALLKAGLDAGPDTRLGQLSGGQRTRAAMAGAMFARPDFLLLDEPTNNLDRDGRTALVDMLASWRAGAIIVSHDRALLETMDAIVEMTSLGAARHGGNWSHYQARKAIELAAAHHDLDVAERQLADIGRKSQLAVERKQRRDAVGGRKGARGDMPRILIGARKERAENSGGDNARLAERQRMEAQAMAAAAREQIETLDPLAIMIAPTGLASGSTVLDMRNVTAGYEPGTAVIRDFSLNLTGPERVAIVGPNGSGKTLLLGLIAGHLSPFSGTIARTGSFAMLDQVARILDPSLSVADNYRALNPGGDDFACRSALARFRFRADAALQTVGTLSGGQMLRAGLACTLGGPHPPLLLVLDEPTNHLDLDMIAAVEACLAAFDGALLVVSHDDAFLDAVGVSRRVEMGQAG